jgi:F420-non-reducing hydrogenase iron-sulfur subunit
MATEKGDFEPLIVGITCNWCTYAAADLAGTSRMKYPPNIRLLRVMCSSRINPSFILYAFSRGADGVFIGGCHPGECHYIDGNYKALRRIELLRKMLDQFGIEPERLRLEWCSAAEGAKFAKEVTDFTAKLKELGPNPLRKEG